MNEANLVRKIVVEGEMADLNTYIQAERGQNGMRSAAKIKEVFTHFVQYQTLKEKPLEIYPVRISMHWYTKDLKIDPDNTAFAKKFVLDGLVKNKVLRNDGRKQIAGFADEYFVDKYNPRVEIFIYTA